MISVKNRALTIKMFVYFFKITSNDFRTEVKPERLVETHDHERLVVIIWISGWITFVTHCFFYHNFRLLSIRCWHTSDDDFWKIVVVEVDEFVVGEIRQTFRMIAEIKGADSFCSIEIIISEEEDSGRREAPAFVNVVKIIFDVYGKVIADFIQTYDFSQDTLFISESSQSVGPLLDAAVVRSDDEVLAAFFIVNGQLTTVNSSWINITSTRSLLSVDCCLLTLQAKVQK